MLLFHINIALLGLRPWSIFQHLAIYLVRTHTNLWYLKLLNSQSIALDALGCIWLSLVNGKKCELNCVE